MDEGGSDQDTGAEVLGVEDYPIRASASRVAGYQGKAAGLETRRSDQ